MVLLRRQKGRSPGLVLALIGTLFFSLGLPQVGVLHHDHPGGELPHVHPDLAVFPFATFPHSHHHESDLPPTHHHHGEHDEAAAAHYIHPHPAVSVEKSVHTQAVYRNVEASGRGHWHTFSVLSRVNLTYTAPLPVIFSCSPY